MSSVSKCKRRINLDFDEWMHLAKNNPDEFETKRQETIESFFEKVPERRQHRLKGLQWKIDQTRKLSSTPMASCISISNMMWESVDRLKDCQYEFVNAATGQYKQTDKKNETSATILKFRY